MHTSSPRSPHVPGWFALADEILFDFVLGEQEEAGDLAELGAYLGRSAITIGSHRRPKETFTVVDLFEDPADTDANARENHREYPTLSRGKFEENYLSVLDDLPVVHQGPSSDVVDIAEHDAHRFVHVDASHLYDHVAEDVRSARLLLRGDGIVVFDDFRGPHTPGVAAAVWDAVVRGGLSPIVLTSQKFYGTWGDPEPWRARLATFLPGTQLHHEIQSLMGHDVFRVWEDDLQGSWKERWLPPAVVRAVRASRNRRSRG